MNKFFERFLPGDGKTNKEEKSEITNVVEQEQLEIPETKPKTLEDIRAAKGEITDLENIKKDLINKYRDNVEELKVLGVNEKQENSAKRSETFNDILNPIEDEIKKISTEISELRVENDLQQKPQEILMKRIERLNELCFININNFLSTRTGKEVAKMISQDEIPTSKPALSPQTSTEYSSFIYKCISYKNGASILDQTEYDSFKNTDMRIKKLLDDVDSKLLDMKTTRS